MIKKEKVITVPKFVGNLPLASYKQAFDLIEAKCLNTFPPIWVNTPEIRAILTPSIEALEIEFKKPVTAFTINRTDYNEPRIAVTFKNFVASKYA